MSSKVELNGVTRADLKERVESMRFQTLRDYDLLDDVVAFEEFYGTYLPVDY